MGIISKNTDYISFSIKVEVDKYIDKDRNEHIKEMELRFIDGIKFMSSSLDSLVNNLARGGQEFWGFESYNDHQHKLIIQKGIYPYEYMDSWDKFKETSLPSMERFYSNLKMSGVSDGDYKHAYSIWREFRIRNMGEYHNLYLRTDVVLLANIFESFRRVCLETYWDAMKFPASTRDIKRFESRNKITINILAFERKKVYICRKGKEYD